MLDADTRSVAARVSAAPADIGRRRRDDVSEARREDVSEALRIRTRLPGIDGLRALAVTVVLVQHVWRFGGPGEFSPDWGTASSILPHFRIGLTLFFVLSGFLLYRPFVAALYDGAARPSLRSYFRSRALRILPAYWVILLAAAFVLESALVRTSVAGVDYGRLTDPARLLAAGLFVQNYIPEWLQTGIGVSWSLNVEVAFYLVLPALVLLAGGLSARAGTARGRVLALLAPVAVLIAISATGKLAEQAVDPVGPSPGFDGDWHSVIARSFWVHASLFGVGMTLALVSVAVERRPALLPARWRLGAVVALPVIMFGALQLYHAYSELSAVACAVLVAIVVLPGFDAARPSLLTRFLEWPPVATIGVASYSVFLWHGPVIHLLRERGLTADGPEGFFVNLVLVVAVTGVLSTLTYRFVERPALRRKPRPQKRRESPVQPVLEAGQQRAAP